MDLIDDIVNCWMDCKMAPGAGFEPARGHNPTGSQGRETLRCDEASDQFFPNGYPLREAVLNLEVYRAIRDTVTRIIVEGNKITVEFSSPDDASKFVSFLQSLGVNSVMKKEIRIEYDERFWDYLTKDRQIDTRTARDYMRYLKKLNGRVIDYNLYLEIVNNKWMVKLVRIYLDYLYKLDRISWEEKERLKAIFKVKKSDEGDEYKINAENLVEATITLREGLYKTILELLLYSGVRLSEVVKMLKEWNEDRLECFDSFCRYKLKWRRGRKRCDYVFFPSRLLPKIRRYIHKVGAYETIRKDIYDYYKIKTKDFRKLHYRLCRRILDKEVCEFYQSRIGSLDESDKHYDELLTRATKNYPKLVRRIDKFVDRIKKLMSDGVIVQQLEVVYDIYENDEHGNEDEGTIREFRD